MSRGSSHALATYSLPPHNNMTKYAIVRTLPSPMTIEGETRQNFIVSVKEFASVEEKESYLRELNSQHDVAQYWAMFA